MRFKEEFELEPNRYAKYPHLTIMSYKDFYERKIGTKIAESLGWEEKEMASLNGPVKELYALDIEAFTTDAWVLFKRKLFFELEKPVQDQVKILQLIKDLEFSIGNKI